MFVKTIIEAIIDYKDFKANPEPLDYIILSIVYFLFFGLVFLLVQKYKFKNTSDLEINEIGENQN